MAKSAPPLVTPAKPLAVLTKWLEPLLLLAPAGVWLVLLLVIPTLLIAQLSLVPNIVPGEIVTPSGLDNYALIFQPEALEVLGRSLFFSLTTTVSCVLLGFPVAYWLAIHVAKRWQNLLLLAFILPLWTSSLLRTFAWQSILRRSGVLNTFLSSLGLPILDLLNRAPAVLIGMTYSLLPYIVLILYASLEKLDKRLLEASADLGADPRQTFWQVTVPQTLPGIAAAALLVFITSMGDFVNPDVLGGTSSMTIARLIYNKFLGATPNWGHGSALSMILILAVSIAIALLIKYGDRNASSI
jgi:spermidine/putrescine transport system permease protein